MTLHIRRLTALAFVLICACSTGTARRQEAGPSQRIAIEFSRPPDTLPSRWRGLIGEYGPDSTLRWYALEREGRMWILDHRGNYVPLAERSDTLFEAPISTAVVAGDVVFRRDSTGRAVSVRSGSHELPRRNIEPARGAAQLRITPVRPIDELRREALVATPPAETGSFRVPELVDITALDSTISLDIRYATINNFLGTPVYERPVAMLQRPAAEALARANQALRPLRYTLMVYDAYRPWYVTKIFWDATPDSLRWLVANPAEGSKHNRGAAVDVTLYDLEARRPVEMTSTYDEATTRARADDPGGTSVQRFHRAVLRRVLENEGFTVNPLEWWHFDYKDWRQYPISNRRIDR